MRVLAPWMPGSANDRLCYKRRVLRRALVGVLAVSALAISGCGDDGGNEGDVNGVGAPPAGDTAQEPAPPMSSATAGRATVKLGESEFGQILQDRRGQAFYLFNKEKAGRSECYDACAKAWPPVMTNGSPRAGTGARGGLLGTTRRRDGGDQVTYAGSPLYYYVDDSPGRVLCHNVFEFGGLWLVVRADGKPASS